MENKQIRLKIVSWNIGSALQNLETSFQLMEELITKHRPEIICFQEFPYCHGHIQRIMSRGSFKDYLYHPCSPSHVAKGWDMGLCIFSKYPLLDKQIYPLSLPVCRIFYNGKEESWHPKYFLKTSIRVEDVSIDLFTGHSFPFYRYGLDVQDFSFIFYGVDNWVAKHASGLYLICADFNCHNAIEHMPFVSTTHRDIYADVGTRPSGRKTDAILVPTNTLCPTILNHTVAMDHNFLFAELLLSLTT